MAVVVRLIGRRYASYVVSGRHDQDFDAVQSSDSDGAVHETDTLVDYSSFLNLLFV